MPKSGSPKGGSPKSKEKTPKGSDKGSKKEKSPKGSDKSSKKDKSPKKEELTPEEIEKAPITHVIFDLDGLLLDSVSIFEEFLNRLIQPYEKHIPHWIKDKIKDKKIESIAKIVVEQLSLPMTKNEFLDYYREWTPEILKSSELLPGVCRLVNYFKKHSIPMAVITDSTEESYNYKILRHKPIFDKFTHAVCFGSDPEANKGKPEPFIYQVCASRFKENVPGGPHNILVFEDTSDGVDSALTAGMKVVWVPDPRVDASLHNFNRNLMVIDNLEKFRPELLRLPYFGELYSI